MKAIFIIYQHTAHNIIIRYMFTIVRILFILFAYFRSPLTRFCAFVVKKKEEENVSNFRHKILHFNYSICRHYRKYFRMFCTHKSLLWWIAYNELLPFVKVPFHCNIIMEFYCSSLFIRFFYALDRIFDMFESSLFIIKRTKHFSFGSHALYFLQWQKVIFSFPLRILRHWNIWLFQKAIQKHSILWTNSFSH